MGLYWRFALVLLVIYGLSWSLFAITHAPFERCVLIVLLGMFGILWAKVDRLIDERKPKQ